MLTWLKRNWVLAAILVIALAVRWGTSALLYVALFMLSLLAGDRLRSAVQTSKRPPGKTASAIVHPTDEP
jgi:hypothetical protein